jgi:hypothetical protein
MNDMRRNPGSTNFIFTSLMFLLSKPHPDF